jgi:TonB family protein
MSDPMAEPRPWTRSRWWLVVFAVFLAHIGLIFALGDRKPIVPRQPAAVPQWRLADDAYEMIALNDPTLFALPHREGFSGAAWMNIPRVLTNSYEWSESPRWLSLPVEQLGAAFSQFMETNVFARHVPELKAAPQLAAPVIAPIGPAPATNSTLRFEGDLTERPLAVPLQLPTWPAADLLAPSTVQVLVDDAGNVISAVLLPPGSGSKDADQQALAIAKTARFEPLPTSGTAARWSRATMAIQWFTVPLPPQTNAAPANP